MQSEPAFRNGLAVAGPWAWLRDDAVPWAVAASLVLHLLLFAVAAHWRSLPPPVETSVDVQMLTPEEFQAASGAAAESPPADRPPPERRAIPNPAPSSGAMVHPTRMLSAAALAEPGSRQARAMLKQIDGTERGVQLCGFEAIEQVHAWKTELQPERFVAYALADLVISGDSITGPGAAIFAAGAWYAMHFACGLSADQQRVVSFEFALGETIPRERWASLNLPDPEPGGDAD